MVSPGEPGKWYGMTDDEVCALWDNLMARVIYGSREPEIAPRNSGNAVADKELGGGAGNPPMSPRKLDHALTCMKRIAQEIGQAPERCTCGFDARRCGAKDCPRCGIQSCCETECRETQ